MKLKLKHRLIFSYFFLALFIIGFISILMNFSVKKGFENYIIEKHDKMIDDIILSIEHTYSGSTYNIESIEYIGVKAIENGLIISVFDQSNQQIWSATEHNAGLCETMISNVRDNMFKHYSTWNGKYTVDTFPLNSHSESIGKISIGYLGPFYFNEEELYYLSTINKVLLFVGFFSLFIAIITGIIISKSITKPISSVVYHLNHIHDEFESIEEKSIHNTVELAELYEASIQLERRIHEQEKLRKQLTQDMAHELKTPLTSIQGQLEAMIDGIFVINKERLESCYEEILRIKSLINDIDSLSRLENSNTYLNLQTFNLEELINSVILSFETELSAQHMTSSIAKGRHYRSELFQHYHGDPYKIKQVFINLMSNAIKYSGKNTSINITLDISQHYICIYFRDTGKGIEPKDIPFIFERFYRADPSRTGHMGLGIGLTLIRAIMDKHEGFIEYDASYTQGAQFILKFPLQ